MHAYQLPKIALFLLVTVAAGNVITNTNKESHHEDVLRLRRHLNKPKLFLQPDSSASSDSCSSDERIDNRLVDQANLVIAKLLACKKNQQPYYWGWGGYWGGYPYGCYPYNSYPPDWGYNGPGGPVEAGGPGGASGPGGPGGPPPPEVTTTTETTTFSTVPVSTDVSTTSTPVPVDPSVPSKSPSKISVDRPQREVEAQLVKEDEAEPEKKEDDAEEKEEKAEKKLEDESEPEKEEEKPEKEPEAEE